MSVRLAVFGLFGSPNLGNEATLAAFLHAIRTRMPGCEVRCVAPRQSLAEVMHGIPVIDMLPLPVAPWLWRLGESRWRARAESVYLRLTESRRRRFARAAIADCVALVVPGTGVIDDFGQGPDDLPLHLDRWTAAACDGGLALNFLSIGASRVAHPLSRARFRAALQRASSCSFRDAASLANAATLGMSRPVSVVPDLAFSLPPQWLPVRSPDWPPRTIGLGVMGYRGWNLDIEEGDRAHREYKRKLAALASSLLGAGYRLRLLIGDTRADNATRDALAAALLAGGHEVAAPPIADFRSLLTELGRCDLIIATRYHNLLLALASGRPVVSLGYADKNDALLADFGLLEFGRAIDDFNPDEVATAVAEFVNRPAPNAAIVAMAAQFRAPLEAQYDALVAAW